MKTENPLMPGRLLTKDEVKYIKDLRKVRSGARKALRSGNPAKRAEAAKALVQTPVMIRRVYLENALNHQKGNDNGSR